MEKLSFQNFCKSETLCYLPNLPQNVLAASFIVNFKHNETIIHENETLKNIYYIIDGKAKITDIQYNGKSILLQFLKSNDWIGELTILGVEEITKNVTSIGNVTCLMIPSDIVKRYLLNDLNFFKELSVFLSKKLLDRSSHFSKNQSYELKYRLATFLLESSNNDIYQESHIMVAEYLGVSYRHLLQIFSDFKSQGLLTKIEKNNYKINRQKLMEISIK
ncbi:cyclic nucleotide-binding protein [Lactococcus lactis subsp. lactis]|jgi:cAMP-binding proteins - catabolite gene activator and regulatory subunit of cAMP-dependent protein kinases|uniref:cyclic nucleotide-binding domain-containing protein n=1 Tax=Lactococcus lactis TaxID=1358 RepID=UPI00223C2DBD|nr:cyclic nucleotide-binding domain-containing protein [Lactococcus lactis]MCT0015542.1 cyclic nucleotide-binding protein [Lactococcus lactis subsp. lactis]